MAVYDAVFLGGGLASCLAARYLKRRRPDWRLLIVEQGTSARWNPGESSVGVAGTFLIRDLGLSTYAYVNLLPKNALRFLFDADQDEFDVTRCSEIGSDMLPVFPTFQIDRKRIVEDLWRLNAELGVEVRLGTTVESLVLGKDGASHRLSLARDGRKETVEARWLVNGSGRASKAAPVFNELSPVTEDPDHRLAASWGRFTKVRDLDALGDDAWRRRVGYTSRYLSTTHLMGRGYWIWHIPIGRDIVSFGVVYDKEVVTQDLQSQAGLRAFMDAHPLSRALLAGSEQLDFQCFGHLPFKRKTFCSPDRWAFVGDAFMFVDPFYSPGSDVISRESYHLEHLLSAGTDALPEVCGVINSYCDLDYEVLKLLYVDQYAGFGSFEVYDIKSLWDFHSYTNRILFPFVERRQLSLDWLRAQVEGAGGPLGLMRAVQKGFIDLRRWLDEEGHYSRRNLEHHSLRQNRFRIEERILRGDYTEEEARRQHLHLCRLTVSELVASRFGFAEFGAKRVVQDALHTGALQAFTLTEAWLAGLLEKVGAKVSESVAAATGERVEARATPECLRRPRPRGFESASPAARAAAEALWSEPARNLVVESLVR